MSRTSPPGLFITGVDTDVGKTYVASLIVRQLTALGLRVGVYKPAASGCECIAGEWRSDDAESLWRASGEFGELERVCPQMFAAAMAPHHAARAEGREVNDALLYDGLAYWRERSDFVVVEGAGGLFAPLNDEVLVAELASRCGYPLVLVTENRLGALHQTIATMMAAESFRRRLGEDRKLTIRAVVLNHTQQQTDELVRLENRRDLERRIKSAPLVNLPFGGEAFTPEIDWRRVAE